MASKTDELNFNPLEDKNLIINCVKERDNKLSFVSQNGKSVVWNRFQRIYYENTETIFVKCINCHNIQKQTKNSGTCGLLRHKCQEPIDYLQTEEPTDEQINYEFNQNQDKSIDIESNESFINYNNSKSLHKLKNTFDESFNSETEDLFPMNDRSFYINLVKSKDKKLSFIPQKGKSEVWNRFERIYYNNCETLYVKCKYCDDILKNKQRGGTSGLLQHRCQEYIVYCESEEANDNCDDNEEKDPLMDKNYIKNLVELRDSKLSFVVQNGRSEVWNRFERICYENTETTFVKCKYCDNVLKHTKTSGTCGLFQHRCQPFIDNYQSEEFDSRINHVFDENQVNERDNDYENYDHFNYHSSRQIAQKSNTFNESIIIENDDEFPVNDKSFYVNLVKSKDKKLSFFPQKGKSEVWNRFERIYYNNCETLYVKCKYCDDILKNKQRGGTSGLLQHRCQEYLDYCQSVEEFDSRINFVFHENEDNDRDKDIDYENNESFINDSNTSVNKFKNTFNELFILENDDSFSMNDRSFYVNLVKSKDQKLSFVPQKGKSQVWNRFERIYYDNCETLYVKCKYCDDIQKNTQRSGTSGLFKHKCQQFLDYCQSDEYYDCHRNDNCDENEEKDPLMDRNYIKNLVELRDSKLSFVEQIGKSEVWNRFERICYENTETLFVKCKNCNNVLKHTKNSGTCGLLKHICLLDVESGDENERLMSDIRLNKKPIDEKLLVKKLSHENQILKAIVEKCMKMMDKCLCINKYNSDERKEISVLVNEYNEGLFEFKECDQLVDKSNQFSKDSDYVKNERRNHLSSNGHESDSKSDNDSEYKPHFSNKKKSLKFNSIRNVRQLPIQIRRNNLKLKVTNDIKRKYSYKKKKKRDPNEMYVCEWPGCEQVFKRNQKLKEHRNRHLEIKNFRCVWPGCEDSFMNKTQLRTHISKYHTNDKPFKCDQCEYSSLYKAQLLEHKYTHTGVKPCVCDWPGCEFKTYFESSLRQHKLRHSGLKPFKCSWPSCEWSFRQSHHLKVHLLKHTGEKPVLCQFKRCDRRFTSRQAMRAHFDKCHKS